MPVHDTRAALAEGINLNLLAIQKEVSSTSYHGGVDPLKLLNHFFETTDHLWMGSARCQELLQRHTPRLALGCAFLLHAMLAFSAYHIASLSPEQEQQERRSYQIAGTWHYSLALKSYRQAIADESVDSDALFACCMLLNLLSFKHLSNDLFDEGENPESSKKNPALNTVGIRFIGGPRILADALLRRSMLEQSIWKPLIHHCEENSVGKNDDEIFASLPGVSQSIVGLGALCRGDETDDNSPFDSALTSLRQFVECYVSDRQQMVELTFCFAIKLDSRFLRFVEEGMPNALLVLCYWYAMVSQVNQWWAFPTAQIEGMKLLRYLRDTADSTTIQELLDFPKELLYARSSII